MKSGMLAAESIMAALQARLPALLSDFQAECDSWLGKELHSSRNFSGFMHSSTLLGAAMVWIDQNLFAGRLPFTLMTASLITLAWTKRRSRNRSHTRNLTIKLPSTGCHRSSSPTLTMKRTSRVTSRSETNRYRSKSTCPGMPNRAALLSGGRIRNRHESDGPRFQINAQNCVHQTCDIKDPRRTLWLRRKVLEGPTTPTCDRARYARKTARHDSSRCRRHLPYRRVDTMRLWSTGQRDRGSSMKRRQRLSAQA